MARTIILSSGGTGGHVFPAISLAAELQTRGYQVVIMTDHRGQAFQRAAGVSRVIPLPVWRVRGQLRSVILTAGIGFSALIALWHIIRLRPLVVVGFGGYPSIPALLAGKILQIPMALHEQNAVLGRANRLGARFVRHIGTSFAKVKFTEACADKVVYTGTPVREEIHAARRIPYQPPEMGKPFHLFITGGSQGARIFSSVIPQALCALSAEIRNRLVVHQHCRKELLAATKKAYRGSGITCDIRPFFDNMGEELQNAHLVIGRGGASTVTELTICGRPAILVPFAAAMDNHQQENANRLAEAGAAWMILEREFTPQKLQEILLKAMIKPKILQDMAKKMHKLGEPDATAKLAQVVESLLPV
jgi:UDP-N-acetylglucosamine--N-acetylmuramyl-(pentapeptide) pyrophosphoryl-undecaprenol N-acetylglucosamine transferase